MRGLAAACKKPVFLLLAVLFLAGVLVFHDYGLTWDEPLFYKYADALGYAYTPANWLSGHFDLNQSYGPSGDDHKNRGPAYLLLAREPVYLLERLHLDAASAWHLVNFMTFLLGVYFVYQLCVIFAGEWASAAGAGLFALQPMLWGHSFINPKDIPFLVFLTGSIWLGIRMVDHLSDLKAGSPAAIATQLLVPALFLGIASANRVLGPFAGLLVVAYFLARHPEWRSAPWIVLYGLLSIVVMLASWPYLWESPTRLLEVIQYMSHNPGVLAVLFAGHIYHAYDLPRRYLPFFLLFALTEFVWPLFMLGLIRAARWLRTDSRKTAIGLVILAWFAMPLAYGIVARPPQGDGMRHFLFIVPPIFVFAAIGLDYVFAALKTRWANIALGALMLSPGLLGIVQLHPYEYTYYNSFAGGTGGAFRQYETDYWLTCYREAVQSFNEAVAGPVKLYVHREADVAQPYAARNVTVLDQRGATNQIEAGDYVLVNTRSNEDRQTFRDAPTLLSVGRAGAIFCVIKRIP
jgi:hypothetical protein